MSDTLALANAPVTPMDLIQRALASGASIEQMTQLFDLKLRVDQDNARTAFNQAMARFKANPPRIVKDVTKQAGQMALHYASLENIVATITPALAFAGLRHSWSIDQTNGVMAVTCLLTHELGHTESASMTAPYDQSGGKNAIQAIASANTYLKRYTLFAVTGLAAGEIDDDGAAAGPGKSAMPEGLLADHLAAISAAADADELKRRYHAAYKAAEGFGDKVAMADIIACKDARKKQVAR